MRDLAKFPSVITNQRPTPRLVLPRRPIPWPLTAALVALTGALALGAAVVIVRWM